MAAQAKALRRRGMWASNAPEQAREVLSSLRFGGPASAGIDRSSIWRQLTSVAVSTIGDGAASALVPGARGKMTFRFKPSDDVRHRVENDILFVTVDRPEKRNPLSLGVLDSIRRIFTGASDDETIRLAVVTGAGDRAFASGGDVTELAEYRTREDAEAFSGHGKAALSAIRDFPVPVIARLNGLALGGGAELALACDLRFAASHARIGFIHGRLCISPSWGGGNDLVRLIGPAKAMWMMASAAILEIDQAQALGVIDLACPPDTPFDGWFEKQLGPLRANPRQVMRAYKAIARTAAGSERAEADISETTHFGLVWAHEDHWKAVSRREEQLR